MDLHNIVFGRRLSDIQHICSCGWAETWAKQQVGCTCCWESLHRDRWIAKWTNQGLRNGLLLPTCCQPWNFYLFWTLRLFYLIRNIPPHSFTYLGCDFYQTVSYALIFIAKTFETWCCGTWLMKVMATFTFYSHYWLSTYASVYGQFYYRLSFFFWFVVFLHLYLLMVWRGCRWDSDPLSRSFMCGRLCSHIPLTGLFG